ncbi:hypothetical protein [uncultured Microbacterium sp.]|uniref:hypothetical protein n=1 Tax=uncultured Microbacterium sp. TaxID=191216 RepID=UPI0025F03A88|nr:hypothetical protein [uncultured Microbacterium sp.]
MSSDGASKDDERLRSELAALEDERRRFAMSIRDGGGYNPAIHGNWERLDREVAHVRAQLGLPAELKSEESGINGWIILAGFIVGLVILLAVLTTL